MVPKIISCLHLIFAESHFSNKFYSKGKITGLMKNPIVFRHFRDCKRKKETKYTKFISLIISNKIKKLKLFYKK